MFFRFSRVHLAQAFASRQSGGVCVADVQFVAVVLATDPTARIQSANYGSCLGPATADDDCDLDLLSGLCGTPGSTRISGVVANSRRAGAPKNFGQDPTTSSRPNASARSRSLSLELAQLVVGPSAMQNFSTPYQAKGCAFFCRAKFSALAPLLTTRLRDDRGSRSPTELVPRFRTPSRWLAGGQALSPLPMSELQDHFPPAPTDSSVSATILVCRFSAPNLDEASWRLLTAQKGSNESHRSGQDQRARRRVVEKVGTEHRADHQGHHRSGVGGCGCADCAQRHASDFGIAGQGAEVARGGPRRRRSGQH